MTEFFGLKTKEPLHFDTYIVAIAVDAKNLVAVDSSGDIVPAADATAVTCIGFAYTAGAVADTITVGKGLMAFDNDTTTAVDAGDVGTIVKVGADETNITISANAGVLAPIGRMKALDLEGKVWVDTNDLGE